MSLLNVDNLLLSIAGFLVYGYIQALFDHVTSAVTSHSSLRFSKKNVLKFFI